MEPHEKILAVFDQLDSALKYLKEQNTTITSRINANEQSNREMSEKQKESIQRIEGIVAAVNAKYEYLERVWKQESIDNNDIRRDQNSLLIEIQLELENLRKKQHKIMQKIEQLQTPIPQVVSPNVTTAKKCCTIQ